MILLINPWIYDFAAYDMWMMPLGLLHLGYLFKKQGFEVKLIDLLDVNYDSNFFGVKRKDTGEGNLPYQEVEKPKLLKDIPRRYKRYGIPEEIFIKELESLSEKPEAILVTSKMTYWYPGVVKTISILKKYFPETKIILGGTYAKLLPQHAKKFSGADIVISDEFMENNRTLTDILKKDIKLFGDLSESQLYEIDLNLLLNVRFLPLLSTLGCPFHCTYCASRKMFPSFHSFSPEQVVNQLLLWSEKYGVKDITIFDDAFSVNTKNMKKILNQLIKSGEKFRIHSPNALHLRYIDSEIAELMRKVGFYTIRFGLESADEEFQVSSGNKVSNSDFLKAIKNLHQQGFKPEEIGIYIMAGLPFQKKEDVWRTLKFVITAGARPKIVEYSPVPGTEMFEKAKQCSFFNLDEPLFQNNTILPCRWDGFTPDDLEEIKLYLHSLYS
ncbi:MAG: radical SAM protein [Candidatus Omnitrophica bacterium]|nr:radical SAM protein [Candidatus Omnitrophota bacterium]MCM8777122.1 radical SAM protein [Candidatus Omnitrophota bacterium]